jgi:hypothetical protein
MRLRTRIWLLGTVACAVVGLSAPVAQGAFGVAKFEALTCTANAPKGSPGECNNSTAAQFFTQAAGHPKYGITDFELNELGTAGGGIKSLRTDLPPGQSTNVEGIAECSMAEFEPSATASPTCSSTSLVGATELTIVVAAGPPPVTHTFTGLVYNLQRPEGVPLEFGIVVPIAPGVFSRSLLVGGVSWHQEKEAEDIGVKSGDYHEFFKISNIPGLLEGGAPIVDSRLIFEGQVGAGLVTNPSVCGVADTTSLRVESHEGTVAHETFTPSLTATGCNLVPFTPSIEIHPSATQLDQPDGPVVELKVPQHELSSEIESSDLQTAELTLPEGMTLNPSAAQGLEGCTPEQVGILTNGTRTEAPVACPEKSILGSVALEVPTLPAGSFTGKMYLGKSPTSAITDPPFTVYLVADSARYGVSVRLQGSVEPNLVTGRLKTTFANNPQAPFKNLKVEFKSGALAPLANPLACGTALTETSLLPYRGLPLATPSFPFVVDSNNSGGACPSPLPFALTQSTASVPTTGGASTNFTFNLARADGQQYLSKVSATLPAGLVGKIPAVPLCPEPQATLGTCDATSQIGTTTATVGSGPAPIQFTGPVYLTGPTGNAPYGMTMVINAAVGPFSLGNDVVRTGIEVDPITARVTVAGNVPTIFKGIPLRLKALSVAINRQGFLVNPTNCGSLTTNTTLTSSLGTTQSLSTPFQATSCSGLAFKPKFTASSNAKTSRANGAALNVKVGYPTGAQANIKSVLVTVPKQLPSRLSTLNKACLEKVFNANPYSCPSSSRVGGATVVTPVLPAKLTGPAYFVSHGGAKFPDLDLVLSGNGITIVMVGNTNIQKGVTTSNFAAVPDVPVTSFETNLPVGSNSAVTAVGSLCKQTLIMPTTITAQNGKVIKQNTAISVSGCPVTILSQRISGHKALITVRAPAAGRVSGSGTNLKTVYKRPGKAGKVTLEVPLSGAGVNALNARSPLAARVRVGFIPKAKGASSSAHTTVVFK